MANLDTTMDDMANNRFMMLYHLLIKQYTASSIFDQTEVSCILMVYYKFVLVNGRLEKMMTKRQFHNLFLVLFEILDVDITDSILARITSDVHYVDPLSWLNLIETFMSTDLELRMKFVFEVYDREGTGFLSREVVASGVEKFFKGEEEDELIELRADMIEFLFSKFDVDKDNSICFEEYAEVVRKQPPLMEFLGQCFPTDNRINIIAHCANIYSFIA